jgi:hypothetical protein
LNNGGGISPSGPCDSCTPPSPSGGCCGSGGGGPGPVGGWGPLPISGQSPVLA